MKRLPILITEVSVGLLALTAGLAALAGCGTSPASRPGAPAASTPAASTPAPGGSTPSPGTSTPATSPSTPAASPAATTCPAPGIYLTGIRVGQHAGFDRVVFQFSGGLPAYRTEAVRTVYSDPKGDVVPLAGQASLRVVFRASAWCQQPVHRTYTGPSALTPFYPRLLAVSAAGDFEQVLSFGIGTAASGPYRAYSLTAPDRVVIDVTHVALGKFPGIWDFTSWQHYWAGQYAWNNGHQPWLTSPAMVVEAWARSRWHTDPGIRQVNANTFRVTEPGGRVDTVTGTVPATVPGPWVITRIVNGTPA
jgi:hypothetical protein